MYSVITSILSSTVGSLCNKAHDWTAERLRDGDVTDVKIREIVVRELYDIKTKLDGLSRKDLLTSYSFLQEGVDLLSVSLDKSKAESQIESLLNEAQKDRAEASAMPSGIGSGILKEAIELLSNDMRRVKINSDKEFESAKKRFEEARKTASHAFCNEALSIKDRIFAAKLRIVSEILECLEHPEIAITGCLSFLKKLHSLPAIRETFSVYINGGVKSMMNKAEREENVKSVILINEVLFHHFSQFSSKDDHYLEWPVIEIADRTFHPIFHWHEVSTRRKSMGNELTQHPKGLILNEKIFFPHLSAINSQGQIVVADYIGDKVKIISANGKTKVVKVSDPREGKVVDQLNTVGVGVDNNDDVYIVRKVKIFTKNDRVESYMLYVLDENYTVKHCCMLDFFQVTSVILMKVVFNKSNNLFIKKSRGSQVYICDKSGKLERMIETGSGRNESMTISDKNEIITPTSNGNGFKIHTEHGSLVTTAKLPEAHLVYSVAFHFITGKILVLTLDKITKPHSFYVLCYSQAGELETTTFVSKITVSEYISPIVTSHQSGPVAVVWRTSIAFI